MENVLGKIRDLTIVIAIYLFFIAWVYIHFYFKQFGLTSSSLSLEYSSYLMYSYNVIFSKEMLQLLYVIVPLILLMWVIKWSVKRYGNIKSPVQSLLKFLDSIRNSLWIIILFAFIIFPLSFKIARETALNDYRQDRYNPQNLKSIQFVFRKDAEYLSPAVVLDSVLLHKEVLANDLNIVKNDTLQGLRFLGENDDYYFILNQQPYNEKYRSLPTGYVYFISKNDVLFSKVILRSSK